MEMVPETAILTPKQQLPFSADPENANRSAVLLAKGELFSPVLFIFMAALKTEAVVEPMRKTPGVLQNIC